MEVGLQVRLESGCFSGLHFDLGECGLEERHDGIDVGCRSQAVFFQDHFQSLHAKNVQVVQVRLDFGAYPSQVFPGDVLKDFVLASKVVVDHPARGVGRLFNV